MRVVFEAELIAITRSPHFGLTEAHLPWLLQAGTISTVVGKLLCGPVVALLGLTRVGIASLVLCSAAVLGVALSSPDGTPLVPVVHAWVWVRLFQTATWPATNQLLSHWFPPGEHGRAWGIMSTGSRIGIMGVTSAIAVRDSWYAVANDMDRGDSVELSFTVLGLTMLLWAVVIGMFLQDIPRRHRFEGEEEDHDDSVRRDLLSKPEDGPWTRFLPQLTATMMRPVFVFGLLAQGMATPIAEFQSQVPILLSRDAELGPAAVGLGLTLWHAGVLLSVLVSGWLFDRASVPQRAFIVACPAMISGLLFWSVLGLAAQVTGTVKLWMVFGMGATVAPANYLLASNLISQHAPPLVMATISSLMDLLGYAITLVLLSGSHGAADHFQGTLVASAGAAFMCAAFTACLYRIENATARGTKNDDTV